MPRQFSNEKLMEQIKFDKENIQPPQEKKSPSVEYGMIHFSDGEWCFGSATSGYNFEAINLIDALNIMAEDGWEYVSTIPSKNYMNPNKHVICKRK